MRMSRLQPLRSGLVPMALGVIELQHVADRSPPLFAGGALEFSIDGDGAVLGQDEGGPFPCEQAG